MTLPHIYRLMVVVGKVLGEQERLGDRLCSCTHCKFVMSASWCNLHCKKGCQALVFKAVSSGHKCWVNITIASRRLGSTYISRNFIRTVAADLDLTKPQFFPLAAYFIEAAYSKWLYATNIVFIKIVPLRSSWVGKSRHLMHDSCMSMSLEPVSAVRNATQRATCLSIDQSLTSTLFTAEADVMLPMFNSNFGTLRYWKKVGIYWSFLFVDENCEELRG